MNLNTYFDNYFWNDLKLIPTISPNENILERPEDFFVHKQILFFGGPNWENYNQDIILIESGKRENFIFSLFIISTIDYYIRNNINLYNTVLQLYDPPKLGYCGFGPHFYHPYTILKKWISNETDYDVQKRKEEIKGLFEFIVSKYPTINLDDFKELIINNITNIPHKFYHPIFFKFLDAKSLSKWKKTVSTLLN